VAWLGRQGFAGNAVALPCVFVAAAILATLLNKQPLSEIGLSCERPLRAICLALAAAVIVLPITGFGLWLLGKAGVYLPAPVAVKGSWLNWAAYQFMYVAVAEEIFFRGYIIGKLKSLPMPIAVGKSLSPNTIILLTSAVIFAAAHIILIGGVLSGLTFFPGLILGWLYLRSKSILAPVLFHGLANLFYAMIQLHIN
jgi:membrane protease YdiL (CAAX protease family)